jgi:hypothetical protein
MDLKPILRTILKQYTLPLDGDHGLARWGRVLENGLKLAIETGANIQIVSLFAVLHDSCRINESTDPEHGLRRLGVRDPVHGQTFALSLNWIICPLGLLHDLHQPGIGPRIQPGERCRKDGDGQQDEAHPAKPASIQECVQCRDRGTQQQRNQPEGPSQAARSAAVVIRVGPSQIKRQDDDRTTETQPIHDLLRF